ncbi:hypothetical protein HU200_044861 [Digitaria exilis]|uniref:Reverse transcriptase zinc-binding domain-containing protein n=1 Tax=Digitaria exilis TaxID=1010633 RepID=A0A835EGK3_9POAL|nr:hypothetical protein HU200_044861 [Digitaria exilis]
MHLFLECQFAQDCWNMLHIQVTDAEPLQTLRAFEEQLSVPFPMYIIIIMSWCIWMARNDLIFKGIPPQLSSMRSRFKNEFTVVILRAKSPYHDVMNLWLQTHF